jgi:hypothetical protein
MSLAGKVDNLAGKSAKMAGKCKIVTERTTLEPAWGLAFKLTRNMTEMSLAGKVDNLAGKSAKMAGKNRVLAGK